MVPKGCERRGKQPFPVYRLGRLVEHKLMVFGFLCMERVSIPRHAAAGHTQHLLKYAMQPHLIGCCNSGEAHIKYGDPRIGEGLIKYEL